MKALIIVAAFVICAATFARADQLKGTLRDPACKVMPMEVIENFLFALLPETQARRAAQRAAERENLPGEVYYPHTDMFADKDTYLVVYLDMLRGLGIYCELKDCSDAEPPPGGIRFGLLNDLDFKKWKCSDTIPSEGLAKEYSCGNAKFHDCSSCGTLVVSNYAGVSIDAELESDPQGSSNLEGEREPRTTIATVNLARAATRPGVGLGQPQTPVNLWLPKADAVTKQSLSVLSSLA